MRELALALGYPWFVAFNRSLGYNDDFVLLPIFFVSKDAAVDFLIHYCKKPTDPRRDWVIPSGKNFTLAFTEDSRGHTSKVGGVVSVEEMERMRFHD